MTMTALERFEQAFDQSYARKNYDAIRIRRGATTTSAVGR